MKKIAENFFENFSKRSVQKGECEDKKIVNTRIENIEDISYF